MRYPLVSVVMPTLNSALFIRETIHSLIDQVYKPFELIVVDGGSLDGTIQIVESYMGDGDIKLIKLSGKDGSMPRSLNAGITAAKGEFIARMDADDVAYKSRLQDQVYFLITNLDVSVVGTGVDKIGERGGSYRSPVTHEDIKNMFLINNPFFHPTIMFRRKLYEEGLYLYDADALCEEDYNLWARLIPVVKCANLDQSLLKYRLHGANSQWDPRKQSFKEVALRTFCALYGIDDEDLIVALAEFQCANFLRYECYRKLRAYAKRAEKEHLPKLGWIHDAMVRENSYPDFLSWFLRAKGWPA